MTDADKSKLRQRTERAQEEARRAHALLAKGEPVAAAVEARKAAEHLMLVMLHARGLKPAGAVESSLTLDRVEQLLREGGALPKGIASHARTVRDHGNRAAHPQASATNEVTERDAQVALSALDALEAWVVRELPGSHAPTPDVGAIAPADDARPPQQAPAAPTPRPAPPPAPAPAPAAPVSWLRRAVGLVVLASLACAAPLVGFGVAVGALGLGTSAPAPAEPLPPVEALPAVPPAEVEPDVPALPALEARDRREALQLQIRNDLAFTPDALAGLGCEELARVRNTLWLRHGYVLRDETERHLHGPITAQAVPGASGAAIRRLFSPTDESNLTVVNAVLDREGCPCPVPSRPNRTCPD